MYKPRYTISDEILRKVAEIESYHSKVDSSYILPERMVELRHRATVEASHSSTSIEGNPLNFKQVEEVLASSKQLTRHEYAEIEVRNYKKALDFIDKRKRSKKPIDLQDILDIHKIITDSLLPTEKVGALRKNPIYIADQNDEVQYTGPEADVLSREIGELLSWLYAANEVHPVIASAILHFHFVSIHPFSDGNGRTTRVLTALYLGLRGYDFRSSLVLDSYYSVDKSSYYKALSLSQDYQGRKTALLNPWLDYFVDGFLSSAKLLSVEVTILSGLTQNRPKIKLSSVEADLLGYAKQFGSLSLKEAESILLGVSKRTVQRRLMKLVEDGYLTIEGNARDTRYVWKDERGIV